MKAKKKPACTKVIGEPNEYTDSPLKKLFLDKAEANHLCLLICDYDKLPIHTVIYTGRNTKACMATYDSEIKTLRINKGYNTVHTILHEMAHNVLLNHKKPWLECYKRYVNLWETRWHLYFKDQTI